MSNYRTTYGRWMLTPKQERRWRRKMWRDSKLAQIEGYVPPVRGKGMSGNPAKRPHVRTPLRGSFSRYVAVRRALGQRPVLTERTGY